MGSFRTNFNLDRRNGHHIKKKKVNREKCGLGLNKVLFESRCDLGSEGGKKNVNREKCGCLGLNKGFGRSPKVEKAASPVSHYNRGGSTKCSRLIVPFSVFHLVAIFETTFKIQEHKK